MMMHAFQGIGLLRLGIVLNLFIIKAISATDTDRPNIVFILADDLGWDDVSFHGSEQIPTPNLDSLAYDGILLSNYYVQPICTPTRGALLTGRHPIHTGLQCGVIFGSQPYGLPLNETIMPQYLNKLGYESHIVGKWHLGFHALPFTPTRRGFDSHYGYYQGMEDYWTHTYEAATEETWGLDFRRNDDVIKTAFGQYSTELFATEAEKIINNHDSAKPLYLYLPFQAVHSANPWKPLEAPSKYYEEMSHIQDENRRIYAAMLRCLDDAVGNITSALHQRGMLNNTIIAFSTDNGGPAAGFDMNHASNFPLRGLKATLWEGGMRGAGFLWSPLLKSSGYTSPVMMQVIDWLPTLLHAAGFDMTSVPSNIDGIDQWTTLNTAASQSLRTEILHNINPVEECTALRVRHMKYLSCKKGITLQWDKWYKPEQMAQRSMNPELWQSQVSGILKALGRPVRKPHPFVLICNSTAPANATTVCDPSKAPCLFNITADPCEYYNLAPAMPAAVDILHHRVQAYERTAVPPGNKPQDPRGFPIYHGGIWVPWINVTYFQEDNL